MFFTVYSTSFGAWRWDLHDKDREMIAHKEGYTSEQACRGAVQLVQDTHDGTIIRARETSVYFFVYEEAGKWQWDLKNANRAIVARGEGYTDKQDCFDAIKFVKYTSYKTPLRESGKKKTGTEGAGLYFDLYQDSDKKWRWKLMSDQGKAIANSKWGYKDKEHCLQILDLVTDANQSAPVHEDESHARGLQSLISGDKKASAPGTFFDVYPKISGKWCWDLIDEKSNTVIVHSEGYASKRNCLLTLDLIMSADNKTPVYDSPLDDPTIDTQLSGGSTQLVRGLLADSLPAAAGSPLAGDLIATQLRGGSTQPVRGLLADSLPGGGPPDAPPLVGSPRIGERFKPPTNKGKNN